MPKTWVLITHGRSWYVHLRSTIPSHQSSPRASQFPWSSTPGCCSLSNVRYLTVSHHHTGIDVQIQGIIPKFCPPVPRTTPPGKRIILPHFEFHNGMEQLAQLLSSVRFQSEEDPVSPYPYTRTFPDLFFYKNFGTHCIKISIQYWGFSRVIFMKEFERQNPCLRFYDLLSTAVTIVFILFLF